jgi:hypothetical protein|tara:strand:+ start:156 stop:446 length:291 start_codon:yes stop_codon:yes gene_type:complete
MEMYNQDDHVEGLIMSDDEWEQVNRPDHYNSNTVETIDLIRDSMESDEYRGYLKGNIFKYVSRYRYKEKENPKKDLLKAQWYLCKLIEEMRNDGQE